MGVGTIPDREVGTIPESEVGTIPDREAGTISKRRDGTIPERGAGTVPERGVETIPDGREIAGCSALSLRAAEINGLAGGRRPQWSLPSIHQRRAASGARRRR